MKSTYVLYHKVHDGRLNAFLDPLITNTLCCRGDAPLSPLSVAVSLQPDDNLSPQQQQSPLIPHPPLHTTPTAYTHIAGAGPRCHAPGPSALGLGCPCSFGLQEVGGEPNPPKGQPTKWGPPSAGTAAQGGGVRQDRLLTVIITVLFVISIGRL